LNVGFDSFSFVGSNVAQVDHFSRYGVPMDEDSEDAEETAEGEGDMEDGFGTPGV
jgi:hypothetical protein